MSKVYINNHIGFAYCDQELDCDFGLFLRHPLDLLKLESGPAILFEDLLLHVLRP